MASIEFKETVSRQFCFGDADFCICEDCTCGKEGPNVPSSGPSRFAVIDDDQLAELAKGKRSKNTANSTTWAVKVFNDWTKARKHSLKKAENVPEDFLTRPKTDIKALNLWLSRFVAEARNKGRKHYSPTSLQGFLRYMRERNIDTPNFLKTRKVFIFVSYMLSWREFFVIFNSKALVQR